MLVYILHEKKSYILNLSENFFLEEETYNKLPRGLEMFLFSNFLNQYFKLNPPKFLMNLDVLHIR